MYKNIFYHMTVHLGVIKCHIMKKINHILYNDVNNNVAYIMATS